MLMTMLALITIGLVGGFAFLVPYCFGFLVSYCFAFLVCFCEKLKKKETETEIEEKVTTCLMETIEVPEIAPQGHYNEYGAWIEE